MADGAKELKYDAFISYRHCELDSFVAINLHRKLEKFKIPKSSRALLKEGVSDKIERVFRDEDELPLATNLSDPIELALTNSGHLIVICTPRLKLSSWCQKEIETFIQMHGREKVLLVLAEGEPAESFPEIMTYKEVESTDADGNKVMVRRPLEPLAADVRGKNNKERLKAMDNAVIKLVAAMKGLNYDDVKLRHREQKMKALVRFWSSVSVAIMVFALVCLAMLAKIGVQKNEIQEKYASSMATASQNLLDSGRRNDALYVARSVLPKRGDYNAESYKMLVTALSPYSVGVSYIPTKTFKTETFVVDYMVSENGKYIALCDASNEVTIYDTESGDKIANLQISFENDGLPYFNFDNEDGFAYKSNDGMKYYDFQSNKEKILCEDSGYVLAGIESDVVNVFAGEMFYGFSKGNKLYAVNLAELGIETYLYYDYDYGYSEDGALLAIVMRGYEESSLIFTVDTKTGEVISAVKLMINGSLCVAVDEQFIYITTMGVEENKSELYLVDTYSVEVYGVAEIPISFVRDIKSFDGKLFLISSVTAALIDKNTFEIKARAEGCGSVINGFVIDDNAFVVDYNGEIFQIGGDYPYGMNVSRMMFDIPTQGDVANVQCAGGKLFYEFYETNYVVLYENNPDANSTVVNVGDFEFINDYEEYYIDEDDEVLDKLEGVNKKHIETAMYSSNGKLIFAEMLDGSIRIYDAKNYKHKKNLYSLEEGDCGPLIYIKEDNIYILDAYPYAFVLNEDLELISKINYVVGYEDHCFILEQNGNGVYYKVPYIPYKDMIKKADKMLGDYEPEEETYERYAIIK